MVWFTNPGLQDGYLIQDVFGAGKRRFDSNAFSGDRVCCRPTVRRGLFSERYVAIVLGSEPFRPDAHTYRLGPRRDTASVRQVLGVSSSLGAVVELTAPC